jgi:hypothetical protein
VIVFLQSRATTGPAPTSATPAELANSANTKSTTKAGGKMNATQRRVASRFIMTALARQHLAEAWDLATPELRDAVSKQQWLRGEMPIPPFPVNNLKSAGYQVVATGPGKLLLQVYLVPNDGTQYEPTRYDMTLEKRNGAWKVSYLVPYQPQGLFSPPK